jgi:hypothetical protein
MTNKEFIKQYINSYMGDSAKNGNMSYNNGLLFSYNTAIAKKFCWGFLVSNTKYSVSTSAQQNLLLKQLEDGGSNIIILSDLPLNNKFEKQEIIQSLQCSLKKIKEEILSSKTKKKKQHITETKVSSLFNNLEKLLQKDVILEKDLDKKLKIQLGLSQYQQTKGKNEFFNIT